MPWKEYLTKTANNEPSKLLIEALGYAQKSGPALDLGAGALNEAYYLSSLGYTVTAVDSNPDVKLYLKEDKHPIDLEITKFNDFSFPLNHYVVINARYSLPFNDPKTFANVLMRITASLKEGGVFVGQLFGPEDEWSHRTDMNFHTREQIETLFSSFTLHKLFEKKDVRPTATGPDKFWHVFDIIASKRRENRRLS